MNDPGSDIANPQDLKREPLRPDTVIPPRESAHMPEPAEQLGGSPQLRVISISIVVAVVIASGGALLVTVDPGALVLIAVGAVLVGLLVVGWLWRRAKRESMIQARREIIEAEGTMRRG